MYLFQWKLEKKAKKQKTEAKAKDKIPHAYLPKTGNFGRCL